jgi:acyl carrier protein phosphodiesterase
MNYLGHAYLSFLQPGIVSGNLMADHIKGTKPLQLFPERIRKGIILHRFIDDKLDHHPAFLRGKMLFREKYGLYSGALMDVFNDHFLANDGVRTGGDKGLLALTKKIYGLVEQDRDWFPAAFAGYFPHMVSHNWLYNYRSTEGIRKSLGGLERRAKFMGDTDSAYTLFITNYHVLNQCYFEIMDYMDPLVRRWLTENLPE